MKTVLRLLAVILFFGTALWWFKTGRNRGWTKNQVAVEKLDETTGIVGIDYEDRLVPGVDILGAAAAGALVLTGLSFLGRRKAVA